jgi:hypothetical protein
MILVWFAMMAILFPFISGRYFSVCSAPVLISALLVALLAFFCSDLDVAQKHAVPTIRIKKIDRICKNSFFSF